VIGVPVVDKDALSKRTSEYGSGVGVIFPPQFTTLRMEWGPGEGRPAKEDTCALLGRRSRRPIRRLLHFPKHEQDQLPLFSKPQIFLPRTPTTGILASSAAVSCTTISTCGTKTLGPMVMRVATFSPSRPPTILKRPLLHTTGIERAKIGFRQKRQRVPRRGRRPGPARSRRPASGQRCRANAWTTGLCYWDRNSPSESGGRK